MSEMKPFSIMRKPLAIAMLFVLLNIFMKNNANAGYACIVTDDVTIDKAACCGYGAGLVDNISFDGVTWTEIPPWATYYYYFIHQNDGIWGYNESTSSWETIATPVANQGYTKNAMKQIEAIYQQYPHLSPGYYGPSQDPKYKNGCSGIPVRNQNQGPSICPPGQCCQ